MKLRWSHAVIYVRDLETMIDFYGKVLGFEVTDRGPLDPAHPSPEVVFLSQAGSDHHQLAFAPLRGEGPSTTLDHVAFRVESLADVKEVAERVAADSRTRGISAVNHGNAWSVYLRDPEDNTIEVFCDSPWAVQQPQLQSWDLAMSEEELRRRTEEQFGGTRGFQPIDEFYAAHRRRFGEE
jgi:catechol 2,3-dioxygenase